MSLPSTAHDPEETFKNGLEVARNAIFAETSHGRNVVIAHSSDSVVGNSAIKSFTEPKNAGDGGSGYDAGT